ncbi:MAG: pre-peptidase C-terminal domain-containing protein, partial [Kiritimatiellae bacterium]|nr:pre-peptidase C-terminal domain-containing protein [Kiritimatiellia bacterium]
MKTYRSVAYTALFGAAMVFFSANLFASNTKGSCQANPAVLKVGSSAVAVTLQDEWDSDWSENTGTPVYWFKFSAQKGQDYTFYTTGATGELEMWIETDFTADEFHDWDYGSAKDGLNVRATFKYDASRWENGMANSCTYYVCVRSWDETEVPVGSPLTVMLASGIVPDMSAPYGSLEKPASYDATKEGTIQGKFLSNSDDYGFYTYSVQMTGGTDYYLQVTPVGDEGVNDIEIGFRTYFPEFDSYSIDVITNKTVKDISDPDGRFVKYIFTPESNATYCVRLSGSPKSLFAFKHELYPRRTVTEHPLNGSINPGSIPVEPANLVLQDTKCSPKTRKYPADSIYDDAIIDKELYGFKLKTGRQYVFWTESTSAVTADLVMELYDSKGACLASNTCCTTTDRNVAIGFAPTVDGTYYIGLAQTGVAVPADLALTFKASEIGVAAAADSAFADAFDFSDSNYLHSVVLSFAANGDRVNSPHTFSRTDWEDWMRVDARKGVTYSLRAEQADGWIEPVAGLSLVADVYTVSNSKLSIANDASGKPMSGLNPYEGFALPAGVNTSYYIRFRVVNGEGLRYGPYQIVTSASAPGGVGVLKVNLVGPETAAIQIVGDAAPVPSYFNGAELLLPNGNVQLKFVSVTGYSVPSTTNVTVAVPGEYTFKYKDSYDPKDDVTSGATVLNISQTVQPVVRTLVDSDPRDIFSFTENNSATTIKRYKFRLDPVEGDAVLSVTNADWGVAANGVTVISNLSLGASTKPWFATVSHSGVGAVDSSYTLKAIAYTATLFSPMETLANVSVMPYDGEAYFVATLEAGRKYSFSYTGSTKLEIEGAGERLGSENMFAFYPLVGGKFVFHFTDAMESFYFRHSVAAARTVGQHTKTGTLTVGVAATVKPGRVNSWTSTYSDSIPDECLYTINLSGNKSYLLSTVGASTNIVMRVYNSTGTLVAESRTDGLADSHDVRALVEPKATGIYYVGLAQEFDEKYNENVPVPNMAVTLAVSPAVQEDEAVALEVKPNVWTDVPQEGFDSNRWTRTYTVAARKDVVYRFRAA